MRGRRGKRCKRESEKVVEIDKPGRRFKGYMSMIRAAVVECNEVVENTFLRFVNSRTWLLTLVQS